MTDDFSKDMLPRPGEAIDPRELARRDLQKNLPKRFYAQAGVEATARCSPLRSTGGARARRRAIRSPSIPPPLRRRWRRNGTRSAR